MLAKVRGSLRRTPLELHRLQCSRLIQKSRVRAYLFAMDAPTLEIHFMNTPMKYHHKVPKIAKTKNGSMRSISCEYFQYYVDWNIENTQQKPLRSVVLTHA